MTKQIFRSILAVSMAVLLASLVLITGVLYGYFQDRVLNELAVRTEYAARGVELDGEAYFEVSKSKKKPFVVHTQMCDVTVLGTKFNVDAYSDKNTFSAALMEGKIKVDNNYSPTDIIYLSPSQQVSLKNGKLDVAPIVDYDIYRWREGLICFTDVNFVELMKRIEKYYGVDMEVENTGLARHVFSGKFRISDGIDNLLRVLQKDVYFDFERSEDGNTIYIR